MAIDWVALRDALRDVQCAVCPIRAEFARRMGVHRNTVDRVLNGDRAPSLETVLAWLEAARVPPSVFFARFDPPPAQPVTHAVTPPPQTGPYAGPPLTPSTPREAELLLRIGAMLTAAAQLAIAGQPPETLTPASPAPRRDDGAHDQPAAEGARLLTHKGGLP